MEDEKVVNGVLCHRKNGEYVEYSKEALTVAITSLRASLDKANIDRDTYKKLLSILAKSVADEPTMRDA